MNVEEAVALVRDAVVGVGPRWADLGAGKGVFTRALVELLGEASRIYAVDHDPRAVAELTRWAREEASGVTVVEADFTQSLEISDMAAGALDGLLFANALHFVKDSGSTLARLVKLLRPDGRVVIVEYDRRAANRWVPYPIGIAQLPALATEAALSAPVVVAQRPSDYGGIIYAARMDRPARE
jgi:SAM-dependent methyltransferase